MERSVRLPRPIALCVERLPGPGAVGPDERFVACVALVGREPGLSLDERVSAGVDWRREAGPLVRLCVALDGRLVLLREPGAPTLTLHRGGRSLELPPGSPVFALDRDELAMTGLRLRLHVHGAAAEVHPPRPVVLDEPRSAAPRWLLATAAALALGATAGGFGASGAGGAASRAAADSGPGPDAGPASRIEVREQPPVPPPPPRGGCGGCAKPSDVASAAVKPTQTRAGSE